MFLSELYKETHRRNKQWFCRFNLFDSMYVSPRFCVFLFLTSTFSSVTIVALTVLPRLVKFYNFHSFRFSLQWVYEKTGSLTAMHIMLFTERCASRYCVNGTWKLKVLRKRIYTWIKLTRCIFILYTCIKCVQSN